uniref:Protein-S-isoprenylcysteine O-methyltransferase n=1 Tax=Strongyloides venezuelensis TaxID=75913 RepID=A0A0K0FKT2_STRVS
MTISRRIQPYLPTFVLKNFYLRNLFLDEYVSLGFYYYIIALIYSIIVGPFDSFNKLLINGLFLTIICCLPKESKYLIYSFQGGLLGSIQGNAMSLLVFRNISIFFHISEFIFTGMSNPRSINGSSFLLDHSIAYWCAILFSWLEFFIEIFYFPYIKIGLISLIGVLFVIFGEIVRKVAIVQAAVNFTHQVASTKLPHHKLVTHGVYSYVRHPAYVGWFFYSIGMQLVLCNPISIIVYTYVIWNFFAERIECEERLLIEFFRDQYRQYQSNVPSGIPFVKGHQC